MEENIRRISLKLNLDMYEDKEVYKILSSKRNKSEFIRKSVLFFARGHRLDPLTIEHIKEVVEKSISETLSVELAGISEKLLEQQAGKAEPAHFEGRIEPDVPTETDEDTLNLSGIEELF